MLEKLHKIKSKGLGEILSRSLQGVNIAAEVTGLSVKSGLLSDGDLLRRFSIAGGDLSQLREYIRSRTNVKFYASFGDREGTIAALRNYFPGDESEVIAAADRIKSGSFDLLGYKDLRFGNPLPDWHFDPVAQQRSPRVHWSKITEVGDEAAADKKVIWELNRHQYFSTLGRAYWLTGDETYAGTWAAHLSDWIANNPPKIGVNWLSSLEVAFRSISWIWSVYFFKDSANFTPELAALIVKYLYLNARHIETYLSTFFSPNTHLTGEALGLYFLGSFLPEFKEAERWKELGYKILTDALDFQVRADGTYCEQSTHYHRYTTDFYANLYLLRGLESGPIDPELLEKLTKLLDFLMHITQPDGETALIGDDDGGRLYFLDDRPIADFRPTLALGAVILRRGDLKFAAGGCSQELLWLTGAGGLKDFASIEAVEPAKKAAAFGEGGYFSVRSGWTAGDDLVLIACGPHGFLNGGHAHADALSFVMSVEGQPVFVDSGTYNYTTDPAARRAFRSSSAHNCLTVNGESSSVPGGAFTWRSMADARIVEYSAVDGLMTLHGTQDGFERLGVGYERRFEIGEKCLLTLTDVVSSVRRNRFELNFILSPQTNVEIETGRVVLRCGPEPVLTVETEINGGGAGLRGWWRIEDCEISARYGEKHTTTRLVFEMHGAGDFSIVNRFSKIVRSK